MADLGTTATALAYTVAQAIYPDGLAQASISGRPTIIRRGWITSADTAQGACSLHNGVDLVTVTALSGAFRTVVEPLGWPWVMTAAGACNVRATISGTNVTISGPDSGAPQGIIGLRIRTGPDADLPDRTAITYAIQTGDTIATIAAGLAGQVDGAYSNLGVATFPDALSIEVQTGGIGTAVRIVRRQTQMFGVTIWSGSYQGRDALGSALDAAMGGTPWIANTDGTQSQIVFAGAIEGDAMQMQGIYRRDLRFNLTFDTIQTQRSALMLFATGMTTVNTSAGPVLQPFEDRAPILGAISDMAGNLYQDAAGNIVFAEQQPYSGLAMDASGNVLQDGSANLAGTTS